MKGWCESVLDLLYPPVEIPESLPRNFPPFCFCCGESFSGMEKGEEDRQCFNCLGRQWYIQKARAAYRNEGFVREVIHEFKYQQCFYHLPLLSKWLYEGFERFYEKEWKRGEWDGIISVPLHSLRRRERGFNQAQELGWQLSRSTKIPLISCLKRGKETYYQAKLRRSERLRNQRGAFQVVPGSLLDNKKFILVDDVFTTGATANECARVLKKNGAKTVCVLTVARS